MNFGNFVPNLLANSSVQSFLISYRESISYDGLKRALEKLIERIYLKCKFIKLCGIHFRLFI